MFVVIVEFTIRDEAIEAFHHRVVQQARDSLDKEAGCHVFDVLIDPKKREKILLYEVYRSPRAFELHLASAHFADFDAAVRDWIIAKSITRYTRL